jgi:hypothetical protein
VWEKVMADWQEAARRNLTAKAWAYMKSGATDERSESLTLYDRPIFNFSPALCMKKALQDQE